MLQPTDGELAQIQLAAYAYNGTPYAWDWYGEPADVAVGIKLADDTAVICFIGSRTVEDWYRDFCAFPHTATSHGELGPLHAGFAAGLDDAQAAIKDALTHLSYKGIVVTGHSLGAARAPIHAASMLLAGYRIQKLVGFAPPRPAYSKLGSILTRTATTLYRTVGADGDGHDYVTDVPPAFLLPFQHVTKLTDLKVNAPPVLDDRWQLFRFHHMELYSGALNPPALSTAAAAAE